ncbi:hypothetical protein NCG89_14650 [Spongiibacter taiwanensis]|uniref:hypothetical protein n=1 Tax=Spongiibacter taiwanensis TaxID=1748242 RepID=UPI0020352354|nr:hypothetical protein [Spongiibacter taiwanensis]USA42770.1 hypothetical protein NCG89_14650 [Spongiibacter taiwanensis]
MIDSDEDIPKVVSEINERMQALHDYLGDRNLGEAKIRFPRGYIRTCASHRHKYQFLSCHTLKSNIAYAKLTSDIYRWLLNRTDLSITAKEMMIKQGIALVGTVAETVVKEVLKGQPGGGRKQNFKKKVQKLLDDGVINQELQAELEWLWDTRNNVHIMLLTDREYNKYEIKHYNRAIKAMQSLRVALGGLP